MSLHLLRPFTQWRSGRSLEAAEQYVERCAGAGFDRFYTHTTRRPRRADELKGGSVYFVRSGYTIFRLPLAEIEARDADGRWPIAMRPELIRVEALKVGFVRGWRYLEGDNAPADLQTSMPADLAAAGDKEFERRLVGAGGSS